MTWLKEENHCIDTFLIIIWIEIEGGCDGGRARRGGRRNIVKIWQRYFPHNAFWHNRPSRLYLITWNNMFSTVFLYNHHVSTPEQELFWTFTGDNRVDQPPEVSLECWGYHSVPGIIIWLRILTGCYNAPAPGWKVLLPRSKAAGSGSGKSPRVRIGPTGAGMLSSLCL